MVKRDINIVKSRSRNKNNFIDGKDLDATSKRELNVPKELNIPNDSDDSIEAMFRNEQSANQNDVKELFAEHKIKARTDLSTRQTKLIAKADYMCKLTGDKDIELLLLDFMTLRISDSRKSRGEFVDGLKARIENNLNQMANNMRGQFAK